MPTPTRCASWSRASAQNAVLHGLRRLANEGTRLSSHALRLIQTLMSSSGRLHAESRQPPNPLEAQRIAAELQTLFQDEDIDRFNPEDHQALLENAAALDPASLHTLTNDPAELGDRALSMTPAALERTLGDTLLELLGAHEERPLDAPLQQLRRLVLDAIQAGQLERANLADRGRARAGGRRPAAAGDAARAQPTSWPSWSGGNRSC
jgi:hypothetical protein